MDFVITKGLAEDSIAREIRNEVFVLEQGFKEEFDEIDQNAFHVVVWANGKAVATGRAFEKEKGSTIYKIGRVAVHKLARGQHFGQAVMQKLEEVIADHGGKIILLSAQNQASGFYSRLGYIPQGKIFFEQGSPHIWMKKVL